MACKRRFSGTVRAKIYFFISIKRDVLDLTVTENLRLHANYCLLYTSLLNGKKATVGIAVWTDKGDMLRYNDHVHLPLLSVFKFHVALAVLCLLYTSRCV